MSAPGTEMQKRFAAAYVRNGGNATKAAIEAGYSAKSAKDLGRYTFSQPHVQEMIMQELTRQRARAGAVGLNALVNVAESETAPAPAKVAAGRALMDFAGLASAAKDGDERWHRSGDDAPNYKAILDAFASMSTVAIAAKSETIQ